MRSTLHSHRISVTGKIDRHCFGYRYFFASFSQRDGRPQKAAARFSACVHRPAVDIFTTRGLLASSARGFSPPEACVRGRVAVGTHVGSCTVGGHDSESIVAPWASARPATTFLTSRACASNSHDGAARAGGSAGLQWGCVGEPTETSNIGKPPSCRPPLTPRVCGPGHMVPTHMRTIPVRRKGGAAPGLRQDRHTGRRKRLLRCQKTLVKARHLNAAILKDLGQPPVPAWCMVVRDHVWHTEGPARPRQEGAVACGKRRKTGKWPTFLPGRLRHSSGELEARTRFAGLPGQPSTRLNRSGGGALGELSARAGGLNPQNVNVCWQS